jgi:acyl carrier protein
VIITAEVMVKAIIEARLWKRGLDRLSNSSVDYIKAGVVDSLGLLGWVLELEGEFNVELTDEDVASAEFRTVEGLTKVIEEKLK